MNTDFVFSLAKVILNPYFLALSIGVFIALIIWLSVTIERNRIIPENEVKVLKLKNARILSCIFFILFLVSLVIFVGVLYVNTWVSVFQLFGF